MEPAEIIYKEIVSEDAGIWYISDETGSKVLIKMPSTSIKAIIKKCKVQLLFGKEIRNNICYFHIGFNVFDFSQTPLSLTSVCKNEFEQKAIFEIVKLNKIYVEIFNEFDFCVAKSIITLNFDEKEKLKDFINNDNLYHTDNEINSIEAELSLNNFQYSIDNKIKIPNVYIIDTLIINIIFSEIMIMNSVFIGYNENASVIINNNNEGELLENTVWAPLQSVFDINIYKNPQICKNGNYRELTDILAFYQYGTFLIETKSLSLNFIVDDDIKNHVDKIQKHIKKAVNQLIGAKKVIERQEKVFDLGSKKEIPIIHSNNPPHCLILVENIYPFGDWTEIVEIIYQKIITENVFLHILDLTEYIKLIKYSKGKIELIDYNLMGRCKVFMNTKNIFIKSKQG